VLQFQLLCRRLRAPSPQCNELFYFYEQSIDSRIERGADRWPPTSSVGGVRKQRAKRR